jgi:hypothetical protein
MDDSQLPGTRTNDRQDSGRSKGFTTARFTIPTTLERSPQSRKFKTTDTGNKLGELFLFSKTTRANRGNTHTMGWNCEACTYLNTKVSSNKCTICETLRSAKANEVETSKSGCNRLGIDALQNRKRPSDQKLVVQATLYGGVATEERNEKYKAKKSKGSQCSDAAATAQSTLSFGSLKVPTKTDDVAKGLVLWKQCADSDVPFSELKERMQIAMKHIFGVEKLRLLQPKAVKCALRRTSQLIVMATGGGLYTSRQLIMSAHAYLCANKKLFPNAIINL